MILVVIIACEIGFWVAIGAGLAARYLFRAPRVGLVLLALAPVIDLILLAVTAVHLKSGAEATWHHGLAALYVGFSVAYGHRMIAWADAQFSYRFAGGQQPARLSGGAYTRKCWGDVARTLLAVALAAGVIFGLTAWVGDADRTTALTGLYPLLLLILAIDTLWAVSYTIWPRKDDARASAATSSAGGAHTP